MSSESPKITYLTHRKGNFPVLETNLIINEEILNFSGNGSQKINHDLEYIRKRNKIETKKSGDWGTI